jgi:aspartyl-tRNA(Asn)/glutamyl-tRNA(Gln) amidotransferase subunit C
MSEDTGKIDIAYVAHLARLQLGEVEQARIAAQLQDILQYVAKLNELAIDEIDPMVQAVPLTNVLRRDEVRPAIDQALIFRNAPEQARELFITPKIVE